ncbi:MAG: hypothetical protein HS115_16455 [Spirochaetales bacterium]|nr:hypothetical protein [Spirochaetales bacterium]
MSAFYAAGILAVALLLGKYLYFRVGIFQKYLIQPALLAGLGLFLLGPGGSNWLATDYYGLWKTWPGILISFLFAALMLGADSVSLRTLADRAVWRQGLYVWVIALGQLALGCLSVYLILPVWPVDPLFGHVIELGWVGGHGAAGSFKALFPESAAGDIALFSATTGLIWGSMSGLLLVGWLRRRVVALPTAAAQSAGGGSGVADREAETPGGMSLSILLLIALVLCSYLVRDGLTRIALDWADSLNRIPVFFITILLALPVRRLLDRYAVSLRLEMTGWLSLVLDALIAAALASVTLQAFLDSWQIFLLLMLVAATWCWFCFFFLAPRMLPQEMRWELALLNYGMSTGITAVGLMLLQSFSARLPLRPIQVYGLAAPLSAPFIGGGVISLALPHFTNAANVGIIGLCAGLATALLAATSLLIKKTDQSQA